MLGHSDQELRRLADQARAIAPITRRFLRAAGIGPGMRVLDVGSGVGDVAFLAAELVGGGGQVIGSDRSDTAVAAAQKTAAERALTNVTFRLGDPAEMAFEQPFDAVVGRYVLQFQPHPEALVRRLAAKLRPGGTIVFHELDWAGVRSFPPAPLYDGCCAWVVETLHRSGSVSAMGAKLYSTFVAAGLAPPELRLEAICGGPERDPEALRLLADVAVTLAPAAERLGVPGVDGDPTTLFDRMYAEAVATGSVIFARSEVGAWTRV